MKITRISRGDHNQDWECGIWKTQQNFPRYEVNTTVKSGEARRDRNVQGLGTRSMLTRICGITANPLSVGLDDIGEYFKPIIYITE